MVAMLEETKTVVQTPQIAHVMLGMLNIDRGYQRDIRDRKVKGLKANWDWRKFDPLSVSRRIDGPRKGELFVWDGQHRYLAASELFSEYQELPCYINDLTYQQEAELFARQHENESAVGGNSRFNALLQAGDPEATDVVRIVQDTGFRVNLRQYSTHKGTEGNAIQAMAALLRLYQTLGPDELRVTLHVISRSWPVGVPERINARIIGGVAHFIHHFPEAKVEHLIAQLSLPDATPQRILQGAAVYSATGGSMGGLQPAASRAILDKYNRGLRGSNRLVWEIGKNAPRKARTAKDM